MLRLGVLVQISHAIAFQYNLVINVLIIPKFKDLHWRKGWRPYSKTTHHQGKSIIRYAHYLLSLEPAFRTI